MAEATRAYERAKQARESEIISLEIYDQALARMESAKAQLDNAQINLDYTAIAAPFDGYCQIGPNSDLYRPVEIHEM